MKSMEIPEHMLSSMEICGVRGFARKSTEIHRNYLIPLTRQAGGLAGLWRRRSPGLGARRPPVHLPIRLSAHPLVDPPFHSTVGIPWNSMKIYEIRCFFVKIYGFLGRPGGAGTREFSRILDLGLGNHQK